MDALHDNSYRKWVKIARLIGESEIPAYVKDYTLPDGKSASTLSDNLFADPARRLYPVDGKAATWLSAAYYALAKQAELGGQAAYANDVAETICKAAAIWGISKDVEKVYAQLMPAEQKTAAVRESDYCWIVKDASGEVVERRYPIFDSIGVYKAAAYFDENRACYEHDTRKMLATNILEKASFHGVALCELPTSLLREAGFGIPSKGTLVSELTERATLMKDAENSTVLMKLAKTIGGASPAELTDVLDKVAATIEAFDRLEGLDMFYGTRLTFPADFVYGVTIKEAEEFTRNSIALGRHVYDVRKLAAEVPAQVFTDTVGWKQESWKPEALKTALAKLPADEQSALDDVITSLCEE